MIEPVKCAVRVNATAKDAFAFFTDKLSAWWPSAYTLAKETLQDIGIENREGGACFEIGLYGFRCDWGRVIVWDPPTQLTFAWHVSPKSAPDPNPDHASYVRVTFTEQGNTTVIEVEHYDIERHGEGSAAYREELASQYGWPFLIGQYAALLNGK